MEKSLPMLYKMFPFRSKVVSSTIGYFSTLVLMHSLKMTIRIARWFQLFKKKNFQVLLTFILISISIVKFRNNINNSYVSPTTSLNYQHLLTYQRQNRNTFSKSFQNKVGQERFFSKKRTEFTKRTSFYNFNSISTCPLVSTLLVGWEDISLKVPALRKEKSIEFEIKMKDSGLKTGGSYQPKNCRSRHKVAIVVPYRNREDHLIVFLRYMHPFLQRQQLNYVLFVVEQSDNLPFNRGMLMNIGYKEAQFLKTFKCFIFHDVDLLPEDDGNPYDCPEDGKPRHMAYIIDIFDYKPTPFGYFGGANAFSSHDFELINGFSNLFWGWGGEDDDLLQRLFFHNLTVKRPFDDQLILVPRARYRTLYHRQAMPNPERGQLISEGNRRHQTDGLVNLSYKMLTIEFKLLYTHILVDLQRLN